MMNPKTYSVTIGIPAYNEAQNIETILESLISQTATFYTLDKIAVVCDGCTDDTETIAKKVARKYPQVSVINDHKRLGKSERLNELYSLNTSEIIITIDADLILGRAYVIDEIVRHFDDSQVAVVGANAQPMKADAFFERLVNSWHRFWYEVREDYRGGDTIHNIQGALLAVRGTFAKDIVYPERTIANSQYLYFAVKAKKCKFYFAKEAIVYFYSPNNIKDYLLTLNRYNSQRTDNAQIFGEWIYTTYPLPTWRKIRALIKTINESPVLTLLALIFHLWYKKTKHLHKSSVNSKGLWQTVTSTKRRIKSSALHGVSVFI